MTVQVTVTPGFGFNLPICDYSFLQSFENYLSVWLLEATKPTIPDFTLDGGLVLVYRAPSLRRRLRQRSLGLFTTRTSSSGSVSNLKSSAACSSAGCMVNWVNGRCNICSSSRRRQLTGNETASENRDRDVEDETDATGNEASGNTDSVGTNDTDAIVAERELYYVDFNALALTASSRVQSSAQLYLLTQLGASRGCLGLAPLLSVKVQYLLNQTFNPSLFMSLQQLLNSLL